MLSGAHVGAVVLVHVTLMKLEMGKADKHFETNSSKRRSEQHRSPSKDRNEAPTKPQRPSGKDLCDALVNRSKTFSVSITGWEAHHLGRLHDQQGSCHSSQIIMGHDLCLRSQWQLCRLWWLGQHLLNLQPVVARRPNKSRPRTVWTFRIPIVLSIHQ